MFNGKLGASGSVTFAKKGFQFDLKPCKNSEDENCYLWTEVDASAK